MLTDSSIRLFVNKSRFNSETLQYLNSSCTGSMCVQLEDYSQVRDNIQAYASGAVRIWIGMAYTMYGLYKVIPKEKLIEDTYSPVMVTKAVKNKKEQALLRASHVRDAVPMIRYLVWLEKNVPKGIVDEFSGAELLDKFRGEEEFSSGPSFKTISASGLNAALAHYSPTKELHRKLSSDEMYLLDSGGQYWDGTTDITRTVHWGTPSAFQKVRDAVPMIRYLVWLEKNVPKGIVDEFSGAELLDKFRGEEEFSSGPSFKTISASGLNAALAHYSPTKELHRKLSSDEMYLLDSGGQYWDGTTDITRTVHWGTPSAFQKEAYTRVLIGNIDLSRLVFPAAISGRVIEAFARRALWNVGLNYGHGTGHGIGNFLCVHEWPVGFQSNNINMGKGMFTSIEPGYYQDGEFGIRLEDVALVVEAKTKYPGTYLTFEVVSLVPYDKNLIDVNLLSPEQLQYLNHYYQTIREKVGPELQRRQLLEELAWLQQHTEPLSAKASHITSLFSLLAVSTLAILS